MAYKAEIIQDSITENGERLTTFVLTYPRFIHAEFMTHRQISRNASSSRAIPIQKVITQVQTDPAMPVYWGKNQSGMQAEHELDERSREEAKALWLEARNAAVSVAHDLMNVGAHKQTVNRILEPFTWITVVATASQWSNFFALRCHPDAQPEFQKLAKWMEQEHINSIPTMQEMHLPFVTEDERKIYHPEYVTKLAVGRCARVSYLTHDGRRDVEEDVKLHDRLQLSGHWSPFEHVARRSSDRSKWGNFVGWAQYRKFFLGECK